MSAFLAFERRRAVMSELNRHRRPWKVFSEAIFHRGGALILLIAFAPLMAAIAMAVRWSDGGDACFAHYRVGRDGRLFRCLKFRSMVVNSAAVLRQLLEDSPQARAEWDRDQKLLHDPRVTVVGRFLRATSLDELPQLINVLRGDMALVGPRPVTLAELERYGESRWHYLAVLPGMTGLWQVSGRNNISYEQRVALDTHYVQRRSFMFDLFILVLTIRVVLRGAGAR